MIRPFAAVAALGLVTASPAMSAAGATGEMTCQQFLARADIARVATLKEFEAYVIGFRDARQLDCMTISEASAAGRQVCPFVESADYIVHQSVSQQTNLMERECKKMPSKAFRFALIAMLISGARNG